MNQGQRDEALHRALAGQAGERAANMYGAKRGCCAEAVIATLNETLGGGLSMELAQRLGAGFCGGMGGAGCVCGALAGAQVVLGLFLGPGLAQGLKEKEFRAAAKLLHDRFKERAGATCCRVLLKQGKEKKGVSCRELTGMGAELVAELLLAHRPELAGGVNREFLAGRDSRVVGMVKRLLGKIG